MMNKSDDEQNNQAPNKTHGELQTAIGVFQLEIKTKTKQKGEYHEELARDEDANDSGGNLVAQRMRLKVLVRLRSRPGKVLFNHVNDADAKQREAAQHINKLDAVAACW